MGLIGNKIRIKGLITDLETELQLKKEQINRVKIKENYTFVDGEVPKSTNASVAGTSSSDQSDAASSLTNSKSSTNTDSSGGVYLKDNPQKDPKNGSLVDVTNKVTGEETAYSNTAENSDDWKEWNDDIPDTYCQESSSLDDSGIQM